MVYVFLADGFEEIEALTPVDILRRAGVDVSLVGVGKSEIIGAHKITVSCDITADEASKKIAAAPENAEMIILPGGMPGADNLYASSDVISSVKAVADGGGFIGAICAAPYILGQLGMLKGRMATCYPGFEDRLCGAEIYDCDVIRDGEIITARAMSAALDFALELLEALRGEDTADKIGKSVLA